MSKYQELIFSLLYIAVWYYFLIPVRVMSMSGMYLHKSLKTMRIKKYVILYKKSNISNKKYTVS